MGSVSEREIRSDQLLRRLESADWEQVQRVATVSFPVRWRQADYLHFLNHPCGYCYGVFENQGQRLMSYFLSTLVCGEIDVISIATLPERRGCGLAKLLLMLVSNDPNVMRITLEVDVGNEPALNLYRAVGFSIRSTRRGYYGGTRDAYLMTRSAAPTVALTHSIKM